MRVLILLALACRNAEAAQASPDPAEIRKHLQESIGDLPWNAEKGYRLTGHFILKVTGEEINYAARYWRRAGAWFAFYKHIDPSKSVEFGFDRSSWVSSAEATAETAANQSPYCAQYDFPYIYSELLRILQEGRRDPAFSLATEGNDVYIRGTLSGEVGATFIFNTVDFFPRKVALQTKSGSPPAWAFAILEPNNSSSFVRYPATSSNRYEIWFSDPVKVNGYRYPRRTDYADQSGIAGTFLLENGEVLSMEDGTPIRPKKNAWTEKLDFVPAAAIHKPSLLMGEGELPAFRARLNASPWDGWRKTNAMVAAWGILAPSIALPIHDTPSPAALTLSAGIILATFIFLVRKRQRGSHKSANVIIVTGTSVWCLALLSGFAAIQVHNASSRGLLTLHLAIRHIITGNPVYTWQASRLLRDLPNELPPSSFMDLASACQSNSLAYDLISARLTRSRQAEIERNLSGLAKPLYGALQGWRSNMSAGSSFAAGAGLTGLVIRFEPYIQAARLALEKALQEQMSAGYHREGPGAGGVAFNNLVNLMLALKQAGKGDYYRHPVFLEHLRLTIQSLSPAGTLPLFSETGLEHSIPAVQFMLKAANHVPEDLGRQCVAGHDRYWMYGHYDMAGWRKALIDLLEPRRAFYENPFLIFHYTRAMPAASLPGNSCVLGDGQAAILRTGKEPDSAYLVLNARKTAVNLNSRDILSFDLYAHGSLLLHGPGFPGRGSPSYPESIETAASNSVTFNRAGQTSLVSSGVTAGMLNQRVFDYVRALADKDYEYGQAQRDIVLARAAPGGEPYFLLIDEIHANDPTTTVQWYLHGRGKLATSLGKISRWTCPPFSSPGLPSKEILMEVYPIGWSGDRRSAEGKLYVQGSLRKHPSQTLILEWEGAKRFCTVLYPRLADAKQPALESISDADTGRIGETDWASLSDPGTRRTSGPFTHVSEFTLVRTHAGNFPALLMIAGLEFQLGQHTISCSKPLNISLDGLNGGFVNTRPDTRIEVRSPEIKGTDRFLLDGEPLSATSDGMLVFTLVEAGTHQLRRAP